MKRITQLSLLVVFTLSYGCWAPPAPDATQSNSESSTSEAGSSTSEATASTPDSAIQQLKTAAKNRDAMAFASMISPDTVAYMNEQQMPYCFEGYLLEVHPDQVPEHKKTPSPDNQRNIELYRAAKEAGIDEGILAEITQPAGRKQLQEFYSQAANSISNKVEFLARSLELNNELQKSLGSNRDAFTLWNEGVFGSIDENGDAASAKVTMNGRDAEIHFQRIDDKWRYHIPKDSR